MTIWLEVICLTKLPLQTKYIIWCLIWRPWKAREKHMVHDMESKRKNQTTLLIITLLLNLVGQKLCRQTEVYVAVGVILDMDSKQGKVIHSCISMAISDFYSLHNNYTTKLVLHTRDSKGQPLQLLSSGK